MRYSISVLSACCEIADDTFLFNEKTNKYFKLNTTGSFLLGQLKSARSTEELAQSLSENFSGISPDESEEVVKHFIDTLIEAQLVQISQYDSV